MKTNTTGRQNNNFTVAVTGSTGQIGSQIVQGLLARGVRVVALSRGGEKASVLAKAGADVRIGRPDDVTYLAESFRGVDAVFAMTPPNYGAAAFFEEQLRVGKALADAVVGAGVRRVVHLSSIGAELPSGTGVVEGLHHLERRFDALSGVAVRHLRPGFFLENVNFFRATIASMNAIVTPLVPTTPVHFVATRDIANAAVEELLGDATGVRVLLGAETKTMPEFAAALGRALGREVGYVSVPYDAATAAMQGAGMSAEAARRMTELYRAMNDGRVGNVGRTADNTTATTVEAFVKEVAPTFAV